MARQRMKLTFPPDLMNTPLVYTMGKQFQVVTNIRRANVSRRPWLGDPRDQRSRRRDRARARLGEEPGRARRGNRERGRHQLADGQHRRPRWQLHTAATRSQRDERACPDPAPLRSVTAVSPRSRSAGRASIRR